MDQFYKILVNIGQQGRDDLILSLAEAGFKVWLEADDIISSVSKNYWICFQPTKEGILQIKQWIGDGSTSTS